MSFRDGFFYNLWCPQQSDEQLQACFRYVYKVQQLLKVDVNVPKGEDKLPDYRVESALDVCKEYETMWP